MIETKQMIECMILHSANIQKNIYGSLFEKKNNQNYFESTAFIVPGTQKWIWISIIYLLIYTWVVYEPLRKITGDE